MRPLKRLPLAAIVKLVQTTFSAGGDGRVAEQCRSVRADTLRRGFALRFFQPPSLWQFQRAMAKRRQRCHWQTLFGVPEIPSDPQRREILDGGEGESLRGGPMRIGLCSTEALGCLGGGRDRETRTAEAEARSARAKDARINGEIASILIVSSNLAAAD